jgi:hypothetical protein
MLRNIHCPPAEGNFCGECGIALKPAIVQDYNRHMGYVDKSDHMTNSYSIRRLTWKWMKKIVPSPSGPFSFEQFYSPHFLWFKINSLRFQTCLGQGPNTRGGRVRRPQTAPRGRSNTSASQPIRLDIRYSEHWPSEGR